MNVCSASKGPSVSYKALNSLIHHYTNLSLSTNTLLSMVYSVLEHYLSIFEDMIYFSKLQETAFLDYKLFETKFCKLTCLVAKDKQGMFISEIVLCYSYSIWRVENEATSEAEGMTSSYQSLPKSCLANYKIITYSVLVWMWQIWHPPGCVFSFVLYCFIASVLLHWILSALVSLVFCKGLYCTTHLWVENTP